MPRLIRAAIAKAKVGTAGVSTGVDIVGDLAIVRLPGLSFRDKKRLGEALMEETGRVRGVFEQVGAIEGDYRLRTLRHLAGEKSTLTLHKENGCSYKVDIETCYFSPRLATERLRVASSVRRDERVLNMFAGVGPFSIPIARFAGAKVTSCEINSNAAGFHRENDRVNKVESLVEVIEGDAADLPSRLSGKFDRVLMPHPSKADQFLPTALKMTKNKGTVVYYRHMLGKDEKEAGSALREELSHLLNRRARVSIRRVREVGPRWVEMAAEIRLSD